MDVFITKYPGGDHLVGAHKGTVYRIDHVLNTALYLLDFLGKRVCALNPTATKNLIDIALPRIANDDEVVARPGACRRSSSQVASAK